MPKVSPEHVEARRTQILDAARRRFAANGFHMTSMDDVIRESGLSAGALYRYFPGKEALILSTIDDTLTMLLNGIRAGLDAADPDESFGATAERVLGGALGRLSDGGLDLSRIALFAWSEAPRNDAVRALLAERYGTLRSWLADIVTDRLRRQGREVGDPHALGATMLSTFMGFVAQRTMFDDLTPAVLRAGLDALIPAPGVTSPPAVDAAGTSDPDAADRARD